MASTSDRSGRSPRRAAAAPLSLSLALALLLAGFWAEHAAAAAGARASRHARLRHHAQAHPGSGFGQPTQRALLEAHASTNFVDALPSSLDPKSGTFSKQGVEVLHSPSPNCTGKNDCWEDYVEFYSGATCTCTQKEASSTVIRLDLPAGTSDEAVKGLADPQLSIHVKGPDGAWIKWVWEIQNQETGDWVEVGDNTVIPPSETWTWQTLHFPALHGAGSSYIKKDGSKHFVLVRQTCVTLKEDAINIDYMRVRFQSSTLTPPPDTSIIALPTSLTSENNSTFSNQGVTVMRSPSADCTGKQDCWDEYVEFYSGATEEEASRTVIRLDLPAGTSDEAVKGLADPQLSVKMKGPDGGWIKWFWEVQNQATKEWVKLGDNTVIHPSETWTWQTLTFYPIRGSASPYISKDGSAHFILVRQTCLTLKKDAINIDYMRVRFQSSTPMPPPDTSVIALPTLLAPEKSTFSNQGVTVMRSPSADCTDKKDCWDMYVEFYSGATEEEASRTIVRLDLPAGTSDEAVKGLADPQLSVKMLGPDGAWITWVWEVKNQATGDWVELGNNTVIAPSDGWTWQTLNFPALRGSASPYIAKDGSAHFILVRQACLTLKKDAIDIDYMRVQLTFTSAYRPGYS
eukprot:tig00000076_g2440.t1